MSSTDLPRSVERPTRVRHLVLAALLLVTIFNYAQRNAISPTATSIEEEFESASIALFAGKVVVSKLDLATGAFFLAYTLMQVPSGLLAQRWGPRLALSLYAAGWSLALIGCSLASAFLGLFVGRLAMGIFQAGIFPCATLILQVWYPATQRGLATALLNSAMLLGSAGGMALAGQLLAPLGWRGVFFSYALPGLVWSAWFVWWFHNRPNECPSVNQAELDLLEVKQPTPAPESPGQDGKATRAVPVWWLILSSLPLLLLCTQQCFRAAASRLPDSRLPTYLEKERGVSKERAAVLASVPQWGGFFGGIVGGALSDFVLRRTGRRRLARNGVAIFGLTCAIAIYLAAWFVSDPTLAIVVLSAGAFLFSFSSPCAYALCIDIAGVHLAVVFGVMNMLGNVGATAFVSSVMTLVNLGGWELALGAWLMLHVGALLCWIFLDPDVVIGARPAEQPS